MKSLRLILLLFFILCIIGCAAHPTISPVPLKKGETHTAIQFSAETIFPVIVYRKGLSDKSDIGFRVGIPIYGSGIDYSRVIFQHGEKDNKYDVMNIGYSLTPNSNFDITFLNVRTFEKKPGNMFYYGLRLMYIPRGISKHESVRMGPLLGFTPARKWSFEIGYYHDFAAGHKILDFTKSNPINIFNPKSDNSSKRPAVTDFGFPSEYSRLVGLSFQLSFKTQFTPKSAK